MNRLLKLLNTVRTELSRFLYWNAPDTLFALLNNIFAAIAAIYHILRADKLNVVGAVFVFPYNSLWMAYQRGRRIFIPSPRERYRLEKIYHGVVEKKYEFKPYVKVDRGDIVLDVGAYIGEFTIPVSSKAGMIIAVEPDPRNFYCLKRNTSHLRNVVLINKAAWTFKGTLDLHLGFRTTDSSLIGVDEKPLGKAVRVRVDTLDNIVRGLSIKEVDFIKIDAEGAEPEVLEGARDLLKITRKVAIDCTPERHGKPTSSICSNILKNAGFRVHITPSNMVFAWK